MTPRYRDASLPDLIVAARALAEEAQRQFGGLTERHLNWKPGTDQWSVGQCFDHLLTTQASYFPIFEAVRSGRRKTAFFERLPLLPRLWGKLMIDAVSPAAPRRLRAPRIFEPARSDIDGAVVRSFAAQQEMLAENFLAVERQNLGEVVITSPVSPLITYSLLDACRILVAHGQRHLQQATRVAQAPAFP